jgi:hypothetical protein
MTRPWSSGTAERLSPHFTSLPQGAPFLVVGPGFGRRRDYRRSGQFDARRPAADRGKQSLYNAPTKNTIAYDQRRGASATPTLVMKWGSTWRAKLIVSGGARQGLRKPLKSDLAQPI